VIVAGDVFDSAAPSDRDIGRLSCEWDAPRDCAGSCCPENHDYARADGLWTRLRAEAPGNVTRAHRAHAVAVSDELVLLPAPLDYRRTMSGPQCLVDALRHLIAPSASVWPTGQSWASVATTRPDPHAIDRPSGRVWTTWRWATGTVFGGRLRTPTMRARPSRTIFARIVSGCLSASNSPASPHRSRQDDPPWARSPGSARPLRSPDADDFAVKLTESDSRSMIWQGWPEAESVGVLSLPTILAVKRRLFYEWRMTFAARRRPFGTTRPPQAPRTWSISTPAGCPARPAEPFRARSQMAAGGPDWRKPALERSVPEMNERGAPRGVAMKIANSGLHNSASPPARAPGLTWSTAEQPGLRAQRDPANRRCRALRAVALRRHRRPQSTSSRSCVRRPIRPASSSPSN